MATPKPAPALGETPENLPAKRTKKPAGTLTRSASERATQAAPASHTKRPAARRNVPDWTGDVPPAKLTKAPARAPKKIAYKAAPALPAGHVKLPSGTIFNTATKQPFFNKPKKSA